MTNEQKAYELSNSIKHDFTIKESNAAYNAALAMAEWKDEQYKELKEATQTLYESVRKIAQLYEPLQLALNNVFIELKLK